MAVVTITAVGAGTWTAPVGVNVIQVECWGGGGAGGQRSTNNSGAGGGGGGAWARRNAMAVTGGVVYNYTVGAGGTDGVTPANGGTTTFTGNVAVCSAGGATSVAANSQTATAGANVSTGDVSNQGGAGAAGTGTISGGGGESGGPIAGGFNAAGITGGTGRADAGDGGNGRNTSADGFPGIQPGGGGGGGFRTTTTTRNGGPGAAGQIRITFTAYLFPALGSSYAYTGTEPRQLRHDMGFNAGAYQLLGTEVFFPLGGPAGISFPAAPETYTVTGTAVTFRHPVIMIAATDSYAVTGQDAILKWGHSLTAVTTTYSVTGTAVTVVYSVSAATKNYLLLGQDVNFVGPGPNKSVLAESGPYSVTGTDVTFGLTFASRGDYTLTGSELFFDYGTVGGDPRIDALPAFYIYESFIARMVRIVPGDPGVYSLTGTIVTLRRGWSLAAATATPAYTVTGLAQTLVNTYPIVAETGVYAIPDNDDLQFILNDVVTTGIEVLGDTYTTVGGDVGLRYARKMFADEGDYPVEVFDVTFDVFPNEAFVFPAEPGVYDLLGTDAGTLYVPTNAYGLAGGAESGVYTVTGFDVVPKRIVLPMAAAGTSYGVTGTAVTLPAPPRKLVAESGVYFIYGATFTIRKRPKPGGGFDYTFGSGAGMESIVQRRRRRR